jgi:hypothetical protein
MFEVDLESDIIPDPKSPGSQITRDPGHPSEIARLFQGIGDRLVVGRSLEGWLCRP